MASAAAWARCCVPDQVDVSRWWLRMVLLVAFAV
jgi:hypothetical protein